jgi:chorismate mutase
MVEYALKGRLMTESLAPLRSCIDELDGGIIHLLAKRFAVLLPERVEYVITRAARNAEPLGLNPAVAQRLYRFIVDGVRFGGGSRRRTARRLTSALSQERTIH